MNINGLEIQWIVSPFTGKARNWESRMANMNNMGQFSGDMDRNEVEIDLNKFMALLQEKSELKDRIRALEDINNVNPTINKNTFISLYNMFAIPWMSFSLLFRLLTFINLFNISIPPG